MAIPGCGRCWFASRFRRSIVVGSGDDHLYAVDAPTGSLLRQVDSDSTLATADDVNYLTLYSSLVAVNTAIGNIPWEYYAGEFVVWSPAVGDGVV